MASLIAPHYGYFGLVPNLGAILATFTPLEFAPLVTTYLAALIQLLVSGYVILCDSPYWDTYPKRITIACLIQLLCPYECWLTTASSQYFLSIMAFFILIEDDAAQNSWAKWPSRIVLFVAITTSPAVTFLLPVFFLKSIRTRSREDWLRTAIVSAGVFIQVFAFIHTCLNASNQMEGRFNSNGFNLIYITFLHFTDAMLGTYYLWCFNYFGIDIRIVNTVLVSFVLYMFYLLIKSLFCKQLQLHAISFFLLTVPAVLLSLGMYSSPRSAFAPAIILTVLIVYECGNIHNRKFFRILALCVLSAVILTGMLTHDMKVYSCDSPPIWKDEVMLWKRDNNHLLKILPYHDDALWYIKLDSK
jgi:hypothetical protein